MFLILKDNFGNLLILLMMLFIIKQLLCKHMQCHMKQSHNTDNSNNLWK